MEKKNRIIKAISGRDGRCSTAAKTLLERAKHNHSRGRFGKKETWQNGWGKLVGIGWLRDLVALLLAGAGE